MYLPMVVPTQECEVRKARLAPIGPVPDVVAIHVMRVGAAREATTAITRLERAANGRRKRARLAADAEGLAALAFHYGDHAGVAAQASRGFDGQRRTVLMLAAAGAAFAQGGIALCIIDANVQIWVSASVVRTASSAFALSGLSSEGRQQCARERSACLVRQCQKNHWLNGKSRRDRPYQSERIRFVPLVGSNARTKDCMNALISGIAGFFFSALGVICPDELIYVPALLSVIVAGGYVGGTIFSLQADGVYVLHIRAGGTASHAADARLGGIWAYGLVGIPAGAIALLIIARIAGIDDTAVATVLSGGQGVAGAVRRVAACLGLFSVTVVGGFLGLNLIRVVSDRVKAEIHRQVSGQVEPLRLLEKGKLLMEEQSYKQALEAFRSLAQQDSTLLPIVWQGRALKRLGRLSEAIDVLKGGLRSRGASDDSFRRAVALWNLACYRSLMNKDSIEPNFVRSVIELLKEALQNAPEFRESLTTEHLDRDLVPLLGNAEFERWRGEVLAGKGDCMRDKKTY